MGSTGKPSCSETCIGFWSLLGKGINSGRVCTGVHVVVVKNQDPVKAVYSECRGLQVVVTMEEEGVRRDSHGQTSNERKFQPGEARLNDEESGLLTRMSDVWKQRFETLKDAAVYYRHSPNAKEEMKQSLNEFTQKRREFFTRVLSNTKPIEMLQTVWQFSCRHIEEMLKSKRD